ncbi:MAG: sigma-70 family RNA polymerase sigma factor, partial [Planctomycetota bacterium]
MQPEALLDHAVFVRELARSLTFGEEDPEDVVQQTWLRAIEHPPAAGPGVKGWLATVLRNVLRQTRRHRGRRVAREALAAKPPAIPTPEEIREREATRREVVEAVLALDEPYRTAVILRYYEDLPPRKIAERLGDPVETVKTRLVRARRMLRGRLDDRHGGDGKRWGFAVALLALLPGEGRAAPVSRALPVAGIAAVLVVAVAVLVTTVTMLGSPGEEPPPEAARATAAPEPSVDADRMPEEGQYQEAGGEEKGHAPGDEGGRERGAAESSGTPAELAVVEGRVVDAETGDPMAGVDVALSIRAEGFPKRHAVTDGEGRYRFEGVPCGVPVIPYAPWCSRAAVLRDAESGKERTLAKGETLTRDFRARPARGVVARVRLLVPDGVELPTEVKVTHEARDPTGQHRVQYMNPRAVSGDPPAVTIFLPLGRSLVGFEAPGLRGDLPARDVAAEGPPLDLTVTLVRRNAVRMRLVTGNGERLLREGVKVTVLMHRE